MDKGGDGNPNADMLRIMFFLMIIRTIIDDDEMT